MAKFRTFLLCLYTGLELTCYMFAAVFHCQNVLPAFLWLQEKRKSAIHLIVKFAIGHFLRTSAVSGELAGAGALGVNEGLDVFSNGAAFKSFA